MAPKTSIFACSMDPYAEQRRQLARMRTSLIEEGFLSEERIVFFETLEKDSYYKPNSGELLTYAYFNQSNTTIASIETLLENDQVDFGAMNEFLKILGNASFGIGAKRVQNEVDKMKEFSKAKNSEGLKQAFQALKREQELLRSRVDPYIHLARIIGPAETAQPPL